MRSKLLVVIAIAVIGVGLDLWTKSWAASYLVDNGPVEVVEDYFHFRFVENPHGAFSLFRNVPEFIRRGGLIVASLLAVVVIGVFLLRPATGWWMTVAFSLVLAGALGNLYDRLFLGAVRDFIDWHYQDKFVWPTFNLADSYISVGVTILVVFTLFSRTPQPRTTPPRSDPPQDDPPEPATSSRSTSGCS